MKYLSKTGDTIIEVLLTMAVLGIVLAGAYAATTRSLNNIYRAQERVEALKLVEGQLEVLDLLGKSTKPADVASPTNIFGATHVFCIDTSNNNAVIDATNPTVNIGAVLPTLFSNSDFGNIANCSSGINSRYHLAIERKDDAGPNTGSIFSVHARWDSAGGNSSGTNGHDEVVVRYRLNRP